MEQRTLGRTGLRVSALGFGCGDVGGLIVRGTPAERERAVRRAIDAGVNYFDTASSYGNGVSEQNLGATLKAVGVRPYVGTKFRVEPADADLAGAVGRSLDASLKRLAMDSVDLLQLHNLIVREDGAPAPGRGLTARPGSRMAALVGGRAARAPRPPPSRAGTLRRCAARVRSGAGAARDALR